MVALVLPKIAGATTVTERTRGSIILQIQEHGEAWYVFPGDTRRYYLGRPADALRVMQALGVGITQTGLLAISRILR